MVTGAAVKSFGLLRCAIALVLGGLVNAGLYNHSQATGIGPGHIQSKLTHTCLPLAL